MQPYVAMSCAMNHCQAGIDLMERLEIEWQIPVSGLNIVVAWHQVGSKEGIQQRPMGLFNAKCVLVGFQVHAVNGQLRSMFATAEISMFTNYIPLLFAVLDIVVMDNLQQVSTFMLAVFAQVTAKDNQLIQGLELRKLC